MKRFITFSTVAVALALLAPTGLATWRGYGSHEPDNKFDSSDFMFFNPPAPTDKKIYFNVYGTVEGVANPNVGATGSQFEPVGSLYFVGMLGEWVDCNGDGYIGLAETAAEEYKSEVLTLPTMQANCPDGSAHNKQGWVTELLHIGRNLGDPKPILRDTRMIPDDAAMVWGDQGRYFPINAPDAPAEGGSCAITPLPKGTLQRTGAFLNYVDCDVGLFAFGNRLGHVWNMAADAGAPIPKLDNPRNWNQTGHPANQETFGQESADNSYVSAVDCSQPTFMTSFVKPVADPLIPDDSPAQQIATNLYAYGPRPLKASPETNANGNVAGTVNRTNEDLGHNPPATSGDENPNPSSDCNTSNDSGGDLYGQLEGENSGVDAAYKTEADVNFNFTAMPRGQGAGAVAFGKGTPGGFGVWASSQSGWFADVNYVNRPDTLRQDLSPRDASIWTFYAHVGSSKTGRTLPSATVGTYGTGFCATFGADSGVRHGWVCDASLWYKNADGSDQTLTWPHARPGQTYELRDVDCYDSTLVTGVPVGPGVGWISDAPCVDP